MAGYASAVRSAIERVTGHRDLRPDERASEGDTAIRHRCGGPVDASLLISLLDVSRVKSTLTEMLDAPVDVTVGPIEKERLQERIEEDLVRAF